MNDVKATLKKLNAPVGEKKVIEKKPAALSISDGFNFGCGFFLAALLFSVASVPIVFIIAVVLSA